MMRRRVRTTIVSGLVGIVGSPLLAVGQTSGASERGKLGSRRAGPQVRYTVPLEVPIERRARLLETLRETLTKTLALTEEQDQQIKGIFDADIQTLREWNTRGPDTPIPSEQPRPTPEEIIELKKEHEEARNAGDHARADQILNRVLYSNKPQPANMAIFSRLSARPRKLRQDVLAVVPPARKQLAVRIWDRWWALYPQTPLDNPVRCVLRAISDPDLGIEDRLQARLQQKVLTAVKSAPPALMERTEQQKAAQRLIDELKSEIPPHRWDHFITTWKELNQQAELDYELWMKLQQQGADANPNSPGE